MKQVLEQLKSLTDLLTSLENHTEPGHILGHWGRGKLSICPVSCVLCPQTLEEQDSSLDNLVVTGERREDTHPKYKLDHKIVL